MNSPQRRWLAAITLGLAAAAAAAAAVWFFLPPAPSTAAGWVRQKEHPEVVLFQRPAGEANQQLFQQFQIRTIKSGRVLHSALNNKNVLRGTVDGNEMDQIQRLQRDLKVDFPDGPEFMRISLSGDDPNQVKVLVNAISGAYLEAVNNDWVMARQQRRDLLHRIFETHVQDWRSIRDHMNQIAMVPSIHNDQARLFEREAKAKERHAMQDRLTDVKLRLMEYQLRERATVFSIAGVGFSIELAGSISWAATCCPAGAGIGGPFLALVAILSAVNATPHGEAESGLTKLRLEIQFLTDLVKTLSEEISKISRDDRYVVERPYGDDFRSEKMEMAVHEDHMKLALSAITELTTELQARPPARLFDEASLIPVAEWPRKLWWAAWAAGAAFGLVLLAFALLKFRPRSHASQDEGTGAMLEE